MCFREFIDTMALRDDLPPLVSFNGDYRPPEAGFFIDATSAPVPEMSPDYLAQHVRPNHLTPALRAAMDQTPGDLLEFTGDGFALPNPEKPEDRQLFPVTLDVPEISWPVAAATDTRRGLFYGVSKGGEGLFYAFDPSSGAWSVMRGMDNFDASGMFYDAAQDRLILVGGSSASSIRCRPPLRAASKAGPNCDVSRDPVPGAAIGLRQLHVVGIEQLRPRHAAGIVHFLMHADGAVAAVVGDHDDDVGAVLAGGRQLLDGHLQAAIARRQTTV
jgi:hypothetical protein